MSPLPERLRNSLIVECGNAALALGAQLSILLDAYDFYVQRYPTQNERDEFELRDLQVSLLALGSLPHQVGQMLKAWSLNEECPLSDVGFEINVLNEFAVHMIAVHRFMSRKKIEMDAFHLQLVNQSFTILRTANRALANKFQTL